MPGRLTGVFVNAKRGSDPGNVRLHKSSFNKASSGEGSKERAKKNKNTDSHTVLDHEELRPILHAMVSQVQQQSRNSDGGGEL